MTIVDGYLGRPGSPEIRRWRKHPENVGAAHGANDTCNGYSDPMLEGGCPGIRHRREDLSPPHRPRYELWEGEFDPRGPFKPHSILVTTDAALFGR
jgi:hypothetical protein